MSGALALSFDAALQSASNKSFKQFGRVSGQEVRPFVGKKTTKGRSVSQTLYSSPFRERVRDALRRRLHPNTNLRANQLAYAVQISQATIWNLYSANGEPSGRVIDKLVGFFGAPFLNEIWGATNIYCLDPRDEQRADLVKRMADIQAELRRLG